MNVPGKNYGTLLRALKSRIQSARVRAALAANAELIHLYWDMGRMIVQQQEREGWGKSVVERLSQDLRTEFPRHSGLSAVNLWRIRSFYHEWNQSLAILSQPVTELAESPTPLIRQMVEDILSQPVTEFEVSAEGSGSSHGDDLPRLLLEILGRIPWGQNQVLVMRLKDPRQRLWYALKTIENGWSRAVLTAQIESDLFSRQGAALTNFARTLPAPDSDLAQGIFKDRYLLDFIAGGEHLRERELESELTTRITNFLLELGKGFAFVGRQYRLDVGGDEFFIDLLFYHLHLRCYIIIDLKTGKFQPEFAGKMNFYLEAVDRQVRRSPDAPSIGLILCKNHNRVVAEYALARAASPMGVATWELTRELPGNLAGELPTVKQIERELGMRRERDGEEEEES